jgi:ribosomal protein S18 acetylase RimI-like enzyme
LEQRVRRAEAKFVRPVRNAATTEVVILWQNRRFGREMIAPLLGEVAVDRSLESILLSVSGSQERAFELYRKVGFETYGVERNALKIGERYVDERYMILPLR